jgi:hypothetical protein
MSEMQMFQLFGLTFFAIGTGMFVNPKFIRSIFKEFENSAVSMFYGGLISLAIGFFLVSFHNVWILSPSLILTVIGWAAVFKGLSLLMFPKSLLRFYKGVLMGRAHIASYFVLGLGIVALYYGYFA